MNSNYSDFWFDDNSSIVDDVLGVEEPGWSSKSHWKLCSYRKW